MAIDAVETVWPKILNGKAHPTGRAGCIPVYDGSQWRVFKNTNTIYQGAENCADPGKVDGLRANAASLLAAYPETVPQLEKLGARVKALLNRRITTYDDVVAWAGSVFNTGPVPRVPTHVQDTIDLAYDDFVVEVKKGVYVIPAFPRGARTATMTLNFSVPGSKTRYGASHEYSQAAFAQQVSEKPKPAIRRRSKPAEGEPKRSRGRPRKDGLVPGSLEAKEADQKKQEAKEARRVTREQPAPVATITELPPRRRRLARIGQRQATAQ